MKMLTLTNVLTLTVHLKSLRVGSYKDTELLFPYWKTLYTSTPPSYFDVSLASTYKMKYLSDALDKCSVSLHRFTSVVSLQDS